MVKVYADNGKFRVEGTFDFGYMGLYKDEKINLRDGFEDVKEWDCLDKPLETENDAAAFLTYYINVLEKKIQANIKLINDEFLYYVFDDMAQPCIEFWEHKKLTVPEFMPDEPGYELYDEPNKAMIEFSKNYPAGEPNDGSIQKPDVEAFLRKIMPMFNWDELIRGIVPEYLSIKENRVAFQCSDSCDGTILCAAYDQLDEELCFTDWHNH